MVLHCYTRSHQIPIHNMNSVLHKLFMVTYSCKHWPIYLWCLCNSYLLNLKYYNSIEICNYVTHLLIRITIFVCFITYILFILYLHCWPYSYQKLLSLTGHPNPWQGGENWFSSCLETTFRRVIQVFEWARWYLASRVPCSAMRTYSPSWFCLPNQ